MVLGNNYSAIHAESVEYLNKNHRGCDINQVTWTSDPTPWDGDPKKVQNCFGFAIGAMGYWQPPSVHGDPVGDPRYPWPDHMRGDSEANVWVSRYAQVAKDEKGFIECDDSLWEDGFEKIVLFHRGGVFAHAAVQVSGTRWRSKLGVLSDLEHPFDFFHKQYGKGMVFLKKERLQPLIDPDLAKVQTSSVANVASDAAAKSEAE